MSYKLINPEGLYKGHTTVKYLVAIDTFTGVFVFVSAVFSGNASDRFTIGHSGKI